MTIAEAINQSAGAFVASCWPALADDLDGGQLELVTADGRVRIVDAAAGIDAWQMLPAGGMRGVAIRVQWPDRDLWASICRRHGGGTFTIREREWPKIRDAVRHRADGWLFPHWWCHGYVRRSDSRLVAAAAVRTTELVAFAQDHWQMLDGMTNHADGNGFKVVGWQQLGRAGYDVVVAPR